MRRASRSVNEWERAMLFWRRGGRREVEAVMLAWVVLGLVRREDWRVGFRRRVWRSAVLFGFVSMIV